MTQLFSNNAKSTLASSITDIQTTLSLAAGTGTLFRSPTGSDYELVTITDGINWEVVKVTSRTTDTLTVTRGFEGAAQAWNAGTRIEGRITKATLERVIQNEATETNGVAIGYLTESSGTSGVALGQESTANYTSSVSLGPWAVSTGTFSTAVGNSASASSYGVAIGDSSSVVADEGISIGSGAAVSAGAGWGQLAVGQYSSVNGSSSYSSAIGASSVNRISNSFVITGLSLVRKDDAEAATTEGLFFTGSEAIVFSKEIDLKTLADDVSIITIPTGATFYPDEVGLVITSASGVTGQPDVSFGITGNTTAVLASTPTTKSAAKGRDIFTPAKDGVNSLTASVKTAATGTALLGRFYWKGILVEDE